MNKCADIIAAIVSFLGLGCKHKHITWPRFDLRRGHRKTYVVCLDCSKELPYTNPELFANSEMVP